MVHYLPVYWVLALLLLSFEGGGAENPLQLSAVEQHMGAADREEASRPSATKDLLLAPLRFYATVLSRIDGDRCPSSPTCSAYSRQAIHKHGALTGWWMTVDRLIRERTEIETGKRITLPDGRPRVYDPLHENDFWVNDEK